MREIKVIIHKDGKVEGSVEGIPGQMCSTELSKIIGNLGQEVSEEHTDEYNMTPDPQHLTVGS